VGRSVIGPQYIHCSHVLPFAMLGTQRVRSKKGEVGNKIPSMTYNVHNNCAKNIVTGQL